MVGSRNEPEQLLELLQAAAGELKTTQADLEAERARSRHLQAQIERLETQLASAKNAAAMSSEHRTSPVVTVPAGIHSVVDEKTGVASVDEAMLTMRNRALEDEVERAKAAEQQLREKLVDVEAEYSEAMQALSKLRNGMTTGEESVRVVKLVQQLNAVSKELNTAKEALAAKEGGAAPVAVAPAASTASSPSSSGAPPSSGSGVIDPGADASKRVTQLEGELALLRSRRDDLNVELARVENDRKLARTRVAELELEAHKAKEIFGAQTQAAVAAEVAKREAAAGAQEQALAAEAAKRTEAEAAYAKEREKHQATAQKLIEGRTRIRELEGSVAGLTARLSEVEGQLARAGEVARKTLAEKETAWNATRKSLESTATATQAQLEASTTERHHVERQYEQLHREMLILLDQRDEARRELGLLKTRLGIQ